MIYDFDGVRITDDTRQREKSDLVLVTKQNSIHISDITNTITPQELMERFGLEDMKVVGITGTNGKTTTAAAIYSLLNDMGKKSALQGTRGFFINDIQKEKKSLTTPPILGTLAHMYEAKKEGCDCFVMEVSSHAIAQNRIEGIDFALKVLTNISQDHLDYHKSMQEYIATKSAFFSDETPKLINKEDKNIQYNVKNTLTYAVEELATYQILAYSMEEGISAVLRFGSQMVDFHSPLLGLFNLYNLTAAIAAVHMLTNEKLENICEAVENFGGVQGRMEIISYDPFIIVDFAHTPDGMQKVFESFPGKNLACVFGAGGERDKGKRAKMGRVAARFCSKIYITSDNPRSEDPQKIADDIFKGIGDTKHATIILDRKEAIQEAIKNLQKDEILLILGKGDEEYQEIGNEKIPFDDREVVREILKIGH